MFCLVGLAALSTLIRAVLATRVHAGTVFSDELGYTKVAQSIGRTGRLALFDNEGLSFSPLYPLVLSPIYAVGASAPTAYALIRIVNALLMSLSVFPAYKIARFVLPRRLSLLVAGLSIVAPPMLYPTFTISESLAYPLCLAAVWALLEAIRKPGPRTDALLVVAILLASAARIQLVVLLPAALTAIAVAERGGRKHWLLIGALSAGGLVGGAVALAGYDVLSLFGRDAVVLRSGFPNVGHFFRVLVRELAGLDLLLGVVPFVGALVAAWAFARSARRPEHVIFAAVATAVTGWLLVEVAFYATLFDGAHLHERFLIYAAPLFLVALVAACRAPVSNRVVLVAAALVALLPVAVPFSSAVDNTISSEAPGLQLFARGPGEQLGALPHATLAAVWLSATLALLYVQVRARLVTVAMLVLLPFAAIWGLETVRVEANGDYARSLLPRHTDWVDRAKPGGDVVLLGGRTQVAAEQSTAFGNLSIARVYYFCKPAFGSEFGEEKVTIDRSGRLRVASGYLRAPYVVAESALGIRGRVLTRNLAGHQVLVATKGGSVSIPLVRLAGLLKCEPSQ